MQNNIFENDIRDVLFSPLMSKYVKECVFRGKDSGFKRLQLKYVHVYMSNRFSESRWPPLCKWKNEEEGSRVGRQTGWALDMQ